MTSRSAASPSRLPSIAGECTLIRSTVTGFAPGTGAGTSVCTCANAGPAPARASKVKTGKATNSFPLIIVGHSDSSVVLELASERYNLLSTRICWYEMPASRAAPHPALMILPHSRRLLARGLEQPRGEILQIPPPRLPLMGRARGLVEDMLDLALIQRGMQFFQP